MATGVEDWERQTVVDRAGEKIGTIEEIFLVEETGQPEWALVKVGRLKSHATLVPLTRASSDANGVRIAYEKGVVEEAPRVDPKSDPSEEQVQEIYRHYGIDVDGGKPAARRRAAATGVGSATGKGASRRRRRSIPKRYPRERKAQEIYRHYGIKVDGGSPTARRRAAATAAARTGRRSPAAPAPRASTTAPARPGRRRRSRSSASSRPGPPRRRSRTSASRALRRRRSRRSVSRAARASRSSASRCPDPL